MNYKEPDSCGLLGDAVCLLVDAYQLFGGTCSLHLQSSSNFNPEY